MTTQAAGERNGRGIGESESIGLLDMPLTLPPSPLLPSWLALDRPILEQSLCFACIMGNLSLEV